MVIYPPGRVKGLTYLSGYRLRATYLLFVIEYCYAMLDYGLPKQQDDLRLQMLQIKQTIEYHSRKQANLDSRQHEIQ